LSSAALAALTVLWCIHPRWRVRENHDRVLRAISHYRHPRHGELVRLLTLLGQWWLLVVVIALFASYLEFGRRARRDARRITVAGATVLVLVLVGKLFLVRTNVNHELGLSLTGFPSGHTADSTALVGLIVLYLPARARPLPAAVAVVLGAALGAAVGWSRLYTGAHTVAEVIGGWLLGVTVILLAAAARIRD
jgi:undecaprenyl-diphosphatase